MNNTDTGIKNALCNLFDSSIKISFVERVIQNTSAEDSTATLKNVITLMRKISLVETKYNRKIYDADFKILKQMLSQICTGNVKTQVTVFSNVSSYVKFCKPDNIYISALTVNDLDIKYICTQKYFKEKKDFLTFVNTITHQKEDENITLTYRIALFLIYSGIQANNVISVLRADYDEKSRTICYNNIKHEITEYINDEIDYYTKVNVLYSSYNNRKNTLLPSEYLLKFTSEKVNPDSIRRYISRLIDAAKLKDFDDQHSLVSLKTVYLSGAFHRAYNAQQNGLEDSNLHYGVGKNNVKEYMQWRKAYYNI